MRLDWKAVLGIAITVLLVWWALSRVDAGDVWNQILRGDLLLLSAAVAVATFGFLIRAMRWKVLLHAVKPDTKLHSRFAAVSIGFMVNNTLPARVGEFARAYALSRVEPVSASGAFGTLVVERLLDALTLLVFLLVAVNLPSFSGTADLSGGVVGAAVDGATIFVPAFLLVVVALVLWPNQFRALAEGVAVRLPGRRTALLVDVFGSFVESLKILRQLRLVLLAVLWTVVFWLWNGFSFWLGMRAFGINLGMSAALFTQTVVAILIALPAAPGFVGTFHAAAQGALEVGYGIDPATGLAFATAYHFGGWVPITVIGLIYAWKLGLSFGDVRGGGKAQVEESGVLEADQPARSDRRSPPKR